MYLQHFGLHSSPFEMAPDARLIFLSEQHKEALAGIGYAIAAKKGVAVLIGDAGTGKTTILTRALQYLPADRVHSCTILNPLLTAAEFLETVLLSFGITEVPPSKALRLKRLRELLEDVREQGRIATLVIDEAHLLSPAVLEEIRLFGNYEGSGQKLLQIVLSGQLPLSELLNREELAQFKQRVAVRVNLNSLSVPDVEKYMRLRWTWAGGRDLPFPPDAVALVAKASNGIPRLVNTISDNALLAAMGASAPLVSADHVRLACKDLDLVPAPAAAAAPVQPPAAHVNSVPTPRPGPAPVSPLFRYVDAGPPKPSFLSRWAERLGLAD